MSVDRVNTRRATAAFAGRMRMADLARLAGVSVATVSRSLSDSQLINSVTKRRVRQIASRHGYDFGRDTPGSLRGSVATFALIMGSNEAAGFLDPLMQGLLAAVAEASREAECDLMILPAELQDRDVQALMDATTADAFLFFGRPDMSVDCSEALSRRLIVWGAARSADYTTIGPDNFAAGYCATRHLIDAGCLRIAYLGDTDEADGHERFHGYLKALDHAGIAPGPDLSLSEPIGADFDGVVCAGEEALSLAEVLVTRARVCVVHYGPVPAVGSGIACVSIDMKAAGRQIVSCLLGAASGVEQDSQLLPVSVSRI